jgi:sugar diacid utilization regulator
MKKKEHTAWASTIYDLRNAALLPQQRSPLLIHALQQVIANLPAAGTALIWPCREQKMPWKVYYVGNKRSSMHPWLSARLDPSIDVTMELVQHDSAGSHGDMSQPLLLPLRLPSTPRAGLWIIWSSQSSSTSPLGAPALEHIEQVRQMLEAVLEVESREEQYFSQSSPLSDQILIADLGRGDHHAVSAFLSLTRLVAGADFTFWAQAYQDIVEITGHLGAKHSGFGFSLLHGQGVGGRVAAYGTTVIGDYRNSPYRDDSVSDLVDNELIRSGIALPVRYSTAHDTNANVAAVLYATRRTASRFSLAECLLLQRLARLLEPFPFTTRPTAFSVPAIQPLSDQKTTWYDITLHSNRIEDVEAWVSKFIKGATIITDSEDVPYIFAQSERLEQMRTAGHDQAKGVRILSLAAPGVHAPGQIYLCPSIALPPSEWPDFFADLVMLCNLVISRMGQGQNQLNRQREQWLQTLLQGQPPKHSENEGYRLGLPMEHGQVWVLVWPPGTIHAPQSTRKRMAAENVVLDLLKSPLLFLEHDMAVVLLDKLAPTSAAHVRNALLKYCGIQPLWIIQGAHYDSFLTLRTVLVHAISLGQKARRDNYGEYLLDVSMFGLDSLLENPGLERELHAFATRLLDPLIAYDRANSSHLTETLVLMRTLGSAQSVAERLDVHVNTIRYRLHRAEEILGRDQTSPKEQTATTLAAFIWSTFHPLDEIGLEAL